MNVFCLLGILAAAVSSQAEVITWTNTSNGNWNVPGNWSPRQVPSTNDIAIITNAGTYTVTLNLNPTLAGLILGGESGTQTLATAGRTLTLNGTGLVNSGGELSLSGVALSGTNQVTIGGLLSWEYGSIDTNAAVVIKSGARMIIASGGNHAKYLYGSLTNEGIITWEPLGSLYVGGRLHNLATGLFDAQVDGTSILQADDNAVLINEGVFRKSAGPGNLNCYVPLCNSGTVDTQIGTVTFAAGSILNPGSTFIGAGATRLNAGTHTLNGTICATNLVLTGAALAGDGTLSGTVTWNSGQINEGASVTLATNSALILTSGVNYAKIFNGNFTNAGTVAWRPVGTLNVAGLLHNLPGALLDLQVDNNSILKSGSAALLINEGVLRKSAGTSAVRNEVPTINRGTVELFPGTLQFDDAFTHAAGTIQLAGGTLRTTQALYLAAGELTGWGTVTADLVNGAYVRPAGSNGALMINGNYQQLLGGTMEFDIAGNLPGSNQSRLLVTGGATLRGTVGVRWEAHYLPEPGTNFLVLSFAGRAGEFCCFDNFILCNQGRRLMPIYSATNLVLATVAAPEPIEVPLRVATDSAALVCWPVEFPGCELFWSTNLSQPHWTLLPGLTNRYLETPPLARQKFFRLRYP